MRVVDVNCVVSSPEEFPDGLVADEAWLVHDASRRDDPRKFDQMLPGARRSPRPRLRAQPVLLPPTSGDHSAMRAIEAVAQGACRMVRVCPGSKGHRYPLVDWILSPLPETCERENLTLAIDYQDAELPWDDVVRFARAFPAVPMVLVGPAVGADRALPAALDVAANLVIELSCLRRWHVLSPLVERFGAHRFVYGSGGRDDREDPPAEAFDDSIRSALLSGTADAIDAGTWRVTHL